MRRLRTGIHDHHPIGYLFVLPSMLGITMFYLVPAMMSLVMMFTDYSFMNRDQWSFTGLDNLQRLMEDPSFHNSVGKTLVFLLTVPASILLAFPVAYLLNQSVYLQKLLRTLYFLPYIMNGVAIAFVWMLLFHPSMGPINGALRLIGIADPPGWMAETSTAIYAVAIIQVWIMIGYNMIIYLAGLQDVPKELLEASRIDGARLWHTIRYVTIPLVSPTTFLLLITGFISAIKTFGIIQATTGGGPGESTSVLSIYIYKTAFRYYEMGYASAISWMLFAIVMLIMLLNWIGQRRWVHY
ncbi:hypothetical protein PA598K_03209 [Paenibacillus sp. 598K]|uniref:carbohydrate ABC transporter permease n=1 Tax=Paenibacillus sp. 598K TaxID=1117987 RepID=UPI000FF9838B|nr:sugar ABC transporter permease [Paenibacillus sp. 598K]GBF74841.1 hypothetical protein PA598K_03209 [Paenibacillus sp. 598K]